MKRFTFTLTMLDYSGCLSQLLYVLRERFREAGFYFDPDDCFSVSGKNYFVIHVECPSLEYASLLREGVLLMVSTERGIFVDSFQMIEFLDSVVVSEVFPRSYALV